MNMEPNQESRERRAKLESLRIDHQPGPLVHGPGDNAEILVHSFYDRRVCRRFRSQLLGSGISSTTREDRVKIHVYVGMRDRETAFDVLAELLKSYPDKRPTGLRRHYDVTIAATLLGITVGFISLWTWEPPRMRIVACLAYAISAFLMGFVVDRCRRNYLHFGQLQFSMKEILGFTGVVALLLALWSFLI